MSVEALKEHSRQLLSVIESGTDASGLSELFEIRAQLLRDCQEALAGEEPWEADDLHEIMALDGKIREALIERRDAVCRELTLLRRGRNAAAAYRERGAAPRFTHARYMDRAG